MDKVALLSDKQKNSSKKSPLKKRPSKSDKIKKTNPKGRSKTNKKKFVNKAKAAIYIGRIPHGFYEDEMKDYFNQFGKVISTYVARSKKTGKSKGYGFVEFEDEEVAKIAAESMNNYLMFNRVLKCRYIPPEERKGKIFVKTINHILPKVKNRIEDAKRRRNHLATLDQATYQKKTQKKINDLKKFFEDKGIDFSFSLNLEDNKTKANSKIERELASSNSESEDETDDQFGVLEIDESDNDIHFKTPPKVKKVIKRSFSSSVAAPNAIEKKENVKYSSLPEIRKLKAEEGKRRSRGIGKKLEVKAKSEKPLVKSFKPKKAQDKKKKKTLKKGVAAFMKQKKGKGKENKKSVGASKAQRAKKATKLGKAKTEKSSRKR